MDELCEEGEARIRFLCISGFPSAVETLLLSWETQVKVCYL